VVSFASLKREHIAAAIAAVLVLGQTLGIVSFVSSASDNSTRIVNRHTVSVTGHIRIKAPGGSFVETTTQEVRSTLTEE
jgi:hypothetical protein